MVVAAVAALQLFVLAGQSNMAGWARPIPPELPAANVWDVSAGALRPAVDPIGDAPGVGAGREFGIRIAAATGAPVGLVNCAVGGTEIARWVPDGDLYQRCLRMARRALPYGKIRGVLFFQGEQDTLTSLDALLWPSRFQTVAAGFRSDFDAPRLPMVFAQLGPDPFPLRHPWWTTVQRLQSEVCLRDTDMIETDDLPLWSGPHFTVAAYQEIGDRFAEAWSAVSRHRHAAQVC